MKTALLLLSMLLLAGILIVLVVNRNDRIAERNAVAAAMLAAEKQAEAEKTAQQTQETLKGVDRAEKAGLITHEKAQEYRDALTGKTKLYKLPNGDFTTNAVAK